ncbi:Tetratricopeptide repeat superfamily protein [Perilla frutescens var. hirtella]|nr:Tetratricopeptide repeat superfamily protein [Perilla frutescens var. hirtella]
MTESGVTVRGAGWDALVKLYVRVGEVKKAEAILEKAIQQRRARPKFTTFLKILLGYAGRGNVHNAEKIFLEMRMAGYCTQPRPYHTLLYAYINAKIPAYGLKERLRRDNVVPDKKLTRLMV